MVKVYYFINDYTTKHGVVKKGDSLTGKLVPSSKKILFEFFEKTDKEKADSGEGVFSLNELDLKNFATDIAPTTDTKKTDDTKKGFNGLSKTNKTIFIISGIALLGLGVLYFVMRKK